MSSCYSTGDGLSLRLCGGTAEERALCARGHRPEVPAAAQEGFWDSEGF